MLGMYFLFHLQKLNSYSFHCKKENFLLEQSSEQEKNRTNTQKTESENEICVTQIHTVKVKN